MQAAAPIWLHDCWRRGLGQFGQSFIVENKPGASGMIGAQVVAKGPADGYSLLVASPAEIALNQNLFKEMAYDPLADLTPITLLAWTPLVLAAHPSFAASTPSDWSNSQSHRASISLPPEWGAHIILPVNTSIFCKARAFHMSPIAVRRPPCRTQSADTLS